MKAVREPVLSIGNFRALLWVPSLSRVQEAPGGAGGGGRWAGAVPYRPAGRARGRRGWPWCHGVVVPRCHGAMSTLPALGWLEGSGSAGAGEGGDACPAACPAAWHWSLAC